MLLRCCIPIFGTWKSTNRGTRIQARLFGLFSSISVVENHVVISGSSKTQSYFDFFGDTVGFNDGFCGGHSRNDVLGEDLEKVVREYGDVEVEI